MSQNKKPTLVISESSRDKEFFAKLPISKNEMETRIAKVWLDFSLCLPIYDEETRTHIRMIMDLDTAKLIPEWFHDLGTACKLYMPQFADYLEYIQQAIPYIMGASNVRPPIDVDESLRDDILKDMQRKTMIANLKAQKMKKQKAKLIKEGGGNDAN